MSQWYDSHYRGKPWKWRCFRQRHWALHDRWTAGGLGVVLDGTPASWASTRSSLPPYSYWTKPSDTFKEYSIENKTGIRSGCRITYLLDIEFAFCYAAMFIMYNFAQQCSIWAFHPECDVRRNGHCVNTVHQKTWHTFTSRSRCVMFFPTCKSDTSSSSIHVSFIIINVYSECMRMSATCINAYIKIYEYQGEYTFICKWKNV